MSGVPLPAVPDAPSTSLILGGHCSPLPAFPPSLGVVAFAGSRSLSGLALELVSAQARQVAGLGHSVSVGCCVGVDAEVIRFVLPSQLVIHAAFGSVVGSGAAGTCRLSAVAVVRGAELGGADVRWWAGGGASVPLRVRLAMRTRVVVESADLALFAFVGGAGSRGTRIACRHAISRRLPCLVWARSPDHLPSISDPGTWVLVTSSAGVPVHSPVSGWRCWEWFSRQLF